MDDPFHWRREWAWIAGSASIGIAVRAYVALHPGPFLFGDVGVFGLMAKHIWRGEDAPMFVYGQDYMGSLAAWLMAPFYGVCGASFTGVLAAHVVWFALAAPVLYRLLHAVGGRWGAVVGMTAVGLGTRPLLDTAAMVGYFEMLPLAALLYLRVDRAARCEVGVLEAARIGGLVGLGCWVNPQFVAPAFAAFVGLVASSPRRLGLARAVAEPTSAFVRAARVVLAVLLVQFALAVGVVLSGRWRFAPFGWTFSAQRPIRYAAVAFGALAAAWCVVEVVRTRRRGPLLVGLACMVAWQIPLGVHRLSGGDRFLGVRLDYSGEHIVSNAPRVAALAADVLVGQTAPYPDARRAGVAALALVVALPALVALVHLAGGLAATVALAPARLGIPAMLALQSLVTLFFALLFGQSPDERYVLLWWLPYVAALAGAAGALARRAWGAPLLLALVVAGSHVRELVGVVEACSQPDARPACRELAAGMRAHGATFGYSTYDWAYMTTYLADEEVRLTCYGGYLPRDRASREACARAPEPTVVLDTNSIALIVSLYESESRRIVDRWSRGRFTYVRLRRPRGSGWIEEIQGEQPR